MCYFTEDKNGQAAGIKEQNGTTALTNGSRQSKAAAAASFDVRGVVKTGACINTCNKCYCTEDKHGDLEIQEW